MLKNLSFILVIIIFCSCSGNKTSAQNSNSFNKFGQEVDSKPEFYLHLTNNQANKMYLYEDLLVIRNTKQTAKNFFFNIYNLKTRKLADSQFKMGGEANEILSPLATGLNNNLLWAYDISASKVAVQPLKQTLANHKNKEFKINALMYAMQLADTLQAFVNGDYSKSSKVQLINLATGKIVKELGNYGETPKGVNQVTWRNANENFLFLQPKGQALVSAYRFTDKIEIFNLSTGKSKVISGPENYQPEFNEAKLGSNNYRAERNEKTKFAFVNGCVTNQYIYLLYSGNNHMSENLDYGKAIFVYNWNGKPIEKINLPSYISCFTVKNDKEAYVFEVKDSSIKKIDLNL
ncbi:BF3164 family lipoprotein [Pedobacter miscanthi]|uniref:BF3164 family lipoprotein n=1 Tax=Pedobacter miscanthi TaxID=2259170 RepID=UPI00292CC3FB|nr:BF3164 family lipoprotein [Pedobacter miscanthi]